MSNYAIRVENLGKKYRIGGPVQQYQTLRENVEQNFQASIRRFKEGRPSREEFWALRDVSFDIKQGEVIGVIGRNGAGKSTLLKILSRVTEPTTGTAEIRGRVGALLEVGTGFHPELTGRENIFLNGAILGMKRSEIERKFDEIVDFSEVEKFIDTPVKRYSSGMTLRLAFAVAAHLEPEILVVDEVLAVGDAEFQRKCLGKMSDVAQEGRTVIFVSHNMSAVLRLTSESMLIEKGELILRAPTAQAVDFYLSRGYAQEGLRIWRTDEVASSAHPFRPISVKILNKEGVVSETVRSTENVQLEINYELKESIKGLRVGLYLLTTRGEYIFTTFDTDDAAQYDKYIVRERGRYTSRCTIPADTLNEGRFVVGVNASSYRIKSYFHDDQALIFNVDASGAPGMQWAETRMGPIRPRFAWKIEAE
jgi:lipopolysaccharide transport system ATP-binding protein